MTGVLDVYAVGLRSGRGDSPRLTLDDGTAERLPVERWLSPADATDDDVLRRARGATIDLGCGPGRHTAALTRRGIFALGVDISPDAVALACRHGAHAVIGSVFGPLPGTGRWRTALLLDGNVGIGGRPARLLRRVAELLIAGGELLIELEHPGVATRSFEARIETGRLVSDSFRWSRVSISAIDGLSRAAGFAVTERWAHDGRWFARLERLPAAQHTRRRTPSRPAVGVRRVIAMELPAKVLA